MLALHLWNIFIYKYLEHNPLSLILYAPILISPRVYTACASFRVSPRLYRTTLQPKENLYEIN